nr:heme-binding protein [Leisingera thetidis]
MHQNIIRTVIDTARAKAAQDGFAINIAVVDASAQLAGFERTLETSIEHWAKLIDAFEPRYSKLNAQFRVRSLRSLYCCSDGVRSCGVAAENLSYRSPLH